MIRQGGGPLSAIVARQKTEVAGVSTVWDRVCAASVVRRLVPVDVIAEPVEREAV